MARDSQSGESHIAVRADAVIVHFGSPFGTQYTEPKQDAEAVVPE